MATDHSIQSGDCLHSIAFENGFFWEALWNHPKNSGLKTRRKNPNILMQGDMVHVPDRTLKEENGATGKRHCFKRKGVPAVLIMRVTRSKVCNDEEPPPESEEALEKPDEVVISDEAEKEEQVEPAANASYIIEIDGRSSTGTTDGDGQLRITISPNARRGRLRVEPGTSREQIIPLTLGGLDPIDSVTGVGQRLRNLGFARPAEGAAMTEKSLAADVQHFQQEHGLQPSGRIDDATRSKLKQIHGS